MSENCCSVNASPSPLRIYRPLIVALALSLGAAAALAVAGRVPFMGGAMGMFLLSLAALQLVDPSGFAALFAAYDPLARRVPGYARAYPFGEAVLGMLYLAGWFPLAVNLLMLVAMTVSTIGVAMALRGGRKLQCACAGSINQLPVGRVTLAEYGLMAAMAAFNLLRLYA